MSTLALDPAAQEYVQQLEGMLTPLALSALLLELRAYWRSPLCRGRWEPFTCADVEQRILWTLKLYRLREREDEAS